MQGPVFDPRPDPHGRRIAYVSGRELRIAELDGSSRTLAGGDGEPDTVSWGSADFVAAEEMNRQRGYWWSPDGTVIAACRVDVSRVPVWHISNPAAPGDAAARDPLPGGRHDRTPTSRSTSARSTARRRSRWSGTATRSRTSRRCDWTAHGLTLIVQSRDQRELEVLERRPRDRRRPPPCSATSDDAWVELVPGTGRTRRTRHAW